MLWESILTCHAVTYVTAHDLFGNSTASIASSLLSDIPKYAAAVASASGNTVKASAMEVTYRMQHKLVFEEQMPIAEILLAPGGNTITAAFWGTQPYARGSVHISSNNISDPPLINPNYFMFDFDTQVQAAIADYVRKVYTTAPLSPSIKTETAPGQTHVPLNATTAQWSPYLKSSFVANSHHVSTVSMLPLELGGVVDSDLRVYGTSNVRVVDASVLPGQLVGHLTSTLYAVAEKAADLIKRDLRQGSAS